MTKIIDFDSARRAVRRPSGSRKLLVCGVIPARNRPRPAVRLVQRIDDAVVRILHFPAPDGPRAA